MAANKEYIILFSGHMIDSKNKTIERFPEYKANRAKEEILLFLKKYSCNSQAIASAASGGDILFHEACMELNIPSEIYLAENIRSFKKNSVSDAGMEWEQRFDKLTELLPVHILPEKYNNIKDSNIWEQTNVWMTDLAIEQHKQNGKGIVLLTLWNELREGKAGGTEHMIENAENFHFKTQNINPLKL